MEGEGRLSPFRREKLQQKRSKTISHRRNVTLPNSKLYYSTILTWGDARCLYSALRTSMAVNMKPNGFFVGCSFLAVGARFRYQSTLPILRFTIKVGGVMFNAVILINLIFADSLIQGIHA